MKVGILTFPHAPSIGAMLQMGALYHAVEMLGHDVEIINYVSERVNHRKKIKLTPKAVLIKIISALFLKNSKLSYREFESSLKMFPDEPTCAENDLREIAERYDRIIVGSDQVWNPVVTGHDMNFYLKFCPYPEKKVSYAASFGYEQVDPKDDKAIAELLKEFSYLGVREKQGRELIKRLAGRDANVVLDPTLLVTPDYLLKQMKPSGKTKKYVLFFCIKPSPALKKRAEKYAQEYGLELITVGGRIKERFDPTKHPEFGVGPGEFLGLVRDSECIMTNSFHGVAISVALHRNFYVEYSSDTNSRLTNLVELLDLQDRIVGEHELIDKDIDYCAVDAILRVQREHSMEYLKTILS